MNIFIYLNTYIKFSISLKEKVNKLAGVHFIQLEISLERVVLPSLEIVTKLPRIYEKLQCKGEPCQSFGTPRKLHTKTHNHPVTLLSGMLWYLDSWTKCLKNQPCDVIKWGIIHLFFRDFLSQFSSHLRIFMTSYGGFLRHFVQQL